MEAAPEQPKALRCPALSQPGIAVQKLLAEQLGLHHLQAMLMVTDGAPQAMLHASFGMQALKASPQSPETQALAGC